MKSIKTRAIVFFSIAILSLCFVTSSFADWSAQTSGTAMEIVSVSFATSQIGVFGITGATKGTYKTIDGGANWTSSHGTGGVADTYYNSGDGKVYSVDAVYSTITENAYCYNNDLENTNTWTSQTSLPVMMRRGAKIVNSTTNYQVGYTMTSPFNVILKSVNGTGSTQLTNPDTATGFLYSIDCVSDTVCFAVGDNGLIVYTTADNDYHSQSIGGTTELRSISMVSFTEGYAVGDSGLLSKYNGISWSTESIPGAGHLYGISCPVSGKCWAVGAGGAIYKTTNGGTSWASETSGVGTDLNAVSFYDATHGWAGGDSGVILSYIGDTQAPTTTATPAGGTYTSAQSVALTVDETATTYYTTDGADPTESSSTYSSPIDIATSTTLKFFSKDTAGNSEAVKTETYVISTTPTPSPTPAPSPIPFDEKIMLKDAVLNQTYQNDQANSDLFFYLLPKAKSIKNLYIKLIRDKIHYLNGFTKKNSYKGYLKLLSNIGTVKKAYQADVSKHINFKVSIRYSKAKLNKTKIKEGNLRLFIKDRKNNWRGPYRIFQNKTTHTLKFKIRNYKIKPPTNPTPNPLDIKTKNRPYAPTFYFGTLKKIKFVIADKNAITTSINSSSPDYLNFE